METMEKIVGLEKQIGESHMTGNSKEIFCHLD